MSKFKTNLHANYQVDTDREENGFWYQATDTIRIKIRRISSKKSADARKEAEKPYTSQLRNNTTLPSAILEEIAAKQLAFGIIADWEGIIDTETSTAIPYSGETAFAIMSDPEMKDFAGEIFQQAMARDNFKRLENEEASKN